MNYVVGSGPAGVACATALLQRGGEVTLLDAGTELEAEQRATVEQLSQRAPEEWDPELLLRFKSNVEADTEGLHRKLAYGSTYPYQRVEELLPEELHNVRALSSLAVGGLSTVWGAALLPYLPEEISDWPISISELADHYRAVLKFLPYSAAHDNLEDVFPLYSESIQDLALSRQGQALFLKLQKNRDVLRQRGVLFGRARLAVQAQPDSEKPGCVRCGLCMYGCPYHYIYSSDVTLRALQSNSRFHYKKSIVVRSLDEQAEGVEILAEDLQTRQETTFQASRVFLACGILPTTRILLQSMKAFDRPVHMGYSQHFMFPLLRWKGTHGVMAERLYTLSQLFLEVKDPAVQQEWVHLQIYGYNDLYDQAMQRSMIGPLFRFMPRLHQWTLERILIVQGYLHSKYSNPIEMYLRQNADKSRPRLVVTGSLNNDVRNRIHGVLKILLKNSLSLGASPLIPWLSISAPGHGSHNIGTFPMRRNPGPFQTDTLGRPTGFRRVHAVDGTVLPSAPATTITLTIMANAHRIGSLA